MTVDKTKGVNFFEGQECRECGAALKVKEVNELTGITLPNGGLINSSTYECTGSGRHRWGTRIDLGAGKLREARFALVSMDPKK